MELIYFYRVNLNVQSKNKMAYEEQEEMHLRFAFRVS